MCNAELQLKITCGPGIALSRSKTLEEKTVKDIKTSGSAGSVVSTAAVQTAITQLSDNAKVIDIVGCVHGRVLPVPDAHGKGEVVQREVLFGRSSLSHIELREVEGGVLIYCH